VFTLRCSEFVYEFCLSRSNVIAFSREIYILLIRLDMGLSYEEIQSFF